MEKRNTIQKELVLNTVRKMKGHVTALEVFEAIKLDYPSIGLGTVYRNLAILAQEGNIRKIEISNGPDRFDFTLENHYHVQCVRCGVVNDVKMNRDFDLMKYLSSDNQTKILSYDILFKGICKLCQNKEMEEN